MIQGVDCSRRYWCPTQIPIYQTGVPILLPTQVLAAYGSHLYSSLEDSS